jgi:NAD+ synthase
MQAAQREIAQALKVQPPFADRAALDAEVTRRVAFIKQCLNNARLKTLVLGISGGVDSLTAALLAQRAINELRSETGDEQYRFIAVRLPYHVQQDEHDAQACLEVIKPDELHTVNIAPAVQALAKEVQALENGQPAMVYWATMRMRALVLPTTKSTIAG